MKESARTALSYIRSKTDSLGIDTGFYKDHDLHIHVPEGATPKDGPSAGVALTCALVSALTGKPARQDVAMTGEVTLRGRVLPIGGVKEKLLAAHRMGIGTVLLPEENARDLKELPADVLKALHVELVKDVGPGDQIRDRWRENRRTAFQRAGRSLRAPEILRISGRRATGGTVSATSVRTGLEPIPAHGSPGTI